MRRAVLWTLGIATAVGCLTAANFRHEVGPVEVDWRLFRPAPPAVAVATPTRGAIARTVASKGVVEPIRQAQVVAKVSGKVTAVLVEDGATVRPGDILVRLDDAPARSRLDAAKTRFETARTNLEIAEAHLRDVEKDPAAATTPAVAVAPAAPPAGFPGVPMPQPVATGPSKLETARNSVDGWKRERKAADSAQEAAQVDLDRTSIRATIDGVVEDLAVEVGDDVFATSSIRSSTAAGPLPTPGLMGGFGLGGDSTGLRPEPVTGPGRPLCTILDPNQLRVRAWIDEADVSLVAPDQPARIFLPDEPTESTPGRITRVAPRGKPTGEVVAYATLIRFEDAGKRPKPGMRVNVEVEVSRQESLLGVPVQAVMHRKRRDLVRPVESRGGPAPEAELIRGGDSEYIKAVFVLAGDQVRLRPIETGLSDERRVEILAGLAPTDRIVIGPFRALDTLEDGMTVKVEADSEEALSLSQGPPPPGRRPTR